MRDYFSGVEELKELPKEVQIDIAEHLISFDEVSVSREYGRYSCFNGSCLSNHYAPDHKVWFFDRDTVMQIPELSEVIDKGQKELDAWYREHGNEVDWEFMMM